MTPEVTLQPLQLPRAQPYNRTRPDVALHGWSLTD